MLFTVTSLYLFIILFSCALHNAAALLPLAFSAATTGTFFYAYIGIWTQVWSSFQSVMEADQGRL